MEGAVKDAILLILISLTTIMLTIFLNVTPMAAVPGSLGLLVGALLVKLNREPAKVRLEAIGETGSTREPRMGSYPAA